MTDNKKRFAKLNRYAIQISFYLPIPAAMFVQSNFALLILALPIIFLACYIGACTMREEYQRAKQLLQQFIGTIAVVYTFAAIHHSSSAVTSTIYMVIAAAATLCWLYRMVKNYQVSRRGK